MSVQSQRAVSSLGSTAHVHLLCNTSVHCFETMFCVVQGDSLRPSATCVLGSQNWVALVLGMSTETVEKTQTR